jgi:peptide/nickel transport system permease protein
LARHKSGLAGAVVLLLIVLLALLANVISDLNPSAISLTARLQPPLSTDRTDVFHLLGTDALGRYLISRM